jgi:hypothetical protein
VAALCVASTGLSVNDFNANLSGLAMLKQCPCRLLSLQGGGWPWHWNTHRLHRRTS